MVVDDLHSQRGAPRLFPLRKTIYFLVFLILFLSVSITGWLFHYARTPGPSGPPDVVVSIPKGISVEKISEILSDAGVIHRDVRFSYLARLKGTATKLRAGEFSLKTGKLPLEVMYDLSTAVSLQHSVTIAEGLKAVDIAAIFAQKKFCDAKEFGELVHDSTFITSLGFEKLKSLEGYLYPDTYFLTRIPEISTKDVIRMMVRRFQNIWAELDGESDRIHDVVILASIVEKETADPSERPRIASVFLNRLAKGMRLQSDPTVIYGLTNFSGNITKRDLKTATKYNTYVIPGLPAGPICNPGKKALDAVLNPSKEPYLYFVSKNNGTHYFSKNLSEHNRAVYKYQKQRYKK